MKRSVFVLKTFKARFKRYSKKFKSLENEINNLADKLLNEPRQGADMGGGLFKIRLASESKGTGKSGGFRVITYYIEQKGNTETIYLVTIYDKSEDESIDKKELLKILKNELL